MEPTYKAQKIKETVTIVNACAHNITKAHNSLSRLYTDLDKVKNLELTNYVNHRTLIEEIEDDIMEYENTISEYANDMVMFAKTLKESVK